jgi:hypothetical protein
VASNIIKELARFQEFQAVVIIWLVGAAVADVVIATTLVIHLVGIQLTQRGNINTFHDRTA